MTGKEKLEKKTKGSAIYVKGIEKCERKGKYTQVGNVGKREIETKII